MRKYKILMLGVSIVMLLAIIIYANPAVLIDLWVRSNYAYILAGFLVAFIAIILGVLKWKILLVNVGLVELFPVQVLGFTLSNFTPGKAAEPVKAVLLKMVKGVSVSSSLTSIIWERVSDVLVLVLLSLLAIGTISATSNFFIAGAISLVVFAGILAVSFLVLYSRKFGLQLFRLAKKFPVLKRLPDNFMDLFYEVRIKKHRIVGCFTLAMVTWLIEGIVLYLALGAFGVYLSPLLLSGIIALSVMIGIASSLPGGLGTTEVVMAFLLGLNGVESGIAVAAVITFRFMTIWFVNLLGGMSFVYLSRKFNIRSVV
jgi:glycosyltransferase 2 family protein